MSLNRAWLVSSGLRHGPRAREATSRWRGDLIGATTTRTGLQVHAELDPGVHQTKVKIGDEQMAAIALNRHDFRGEWNYTLRPDPRHADR